MSGELDIPLTPELTSNSPFMKPPTENISSSSTEDDPYDPSFNSPSDNKSKLN